MQRIVVENNVLAAKIKARTEELAYLKQKYQNMEDFFKKLNI